MGDVVRFPVPTPSADPPAEQDADQPLWREVVGRELRAERHTSGRTLTDVASAAGVSTQYLSEVERGLKEPSSEILEAVSGALGLRLVDLTRRTTRRLEAAGPAGPLALAA